MKALISFLVLFLFININPVEAKSKKRVKASKLTFKTMTRSQYKKLGAHERIYYKNKLAQTLRKYEKRAMKGKKFANNKWFDVSMFSKAFANNGETCPVGGQSLTFDGGCSVRKSSYFNNKKCESKKTPQHDTFECGAAYGNICVAFDKGSFEISNNCYTQSVAKRTFKPAAFQDFMLKECKYNKDSLSLPASKKRYDNCKQAHYDNLSVYASVEAIEQAQEESQAAQFPLSKQSPEFCKAGASGCKLCRANESCQLCTDKGDGLKCSTVFTFQPNKHEAYLKAIKAGLYDGLSDFIDVDGNNERINAKRLYNKTCDDLNYSNSDISEYLGLKEKIDSYELLKKSNMCNGGSSSPETEPSSGGTEV